MALGKIALLPLVDNYIRRRSGVYRSAHRNQASLSLLEYNFRASVYRLVHDNIALLPFWLNIISGGSW